METQVTRMEEDPPTHTPTRSPRSHCGARLLGRQGDALFTRRVGRDLLPPLALTRGWSYSPLTRVTNSPGSDHAVPNHEPHLVSECLLLASLRGTCTAAGSRPLCPDCRRRRAVSGALPRTPPGGQGLRVASHPAHQRDGPFLCLLHQCN